MFVHLCFRGPSLPIDTYPSTYKDELRKAGLDAFPPFYGFTAAEIGKLYAVFCKCMGISCCLSAERICVALHLGLNGAVIADSSKTVFKPVSCQEFIKLVEAARAGARTCADCQAQRAKCDSAENAIKFLIAVRSASILPGLLTSSCAQNGLKAQEKLTMKH